MHWIYRKEHLWWAASVRKMYLFEFSVAQHSDSGFYLAFVLDFYIFAAFCRLELWFKLLNYELWFCRLELWFNHDLNLRFFEYLANVYFTSPLILRNMLLTRTNSTAAVISLQIIKLIGNVMKVYKLVLKYFLRV